MQSLGQNNVEHMLELPAIEIGDKVQVEEIITVTRRLTQLLQEESVHLRHMRIKPVGALQDEKNRLIGWLEAQQKIIAINPVMRDSVDDNAQRALSEASENFARAVEENYHQASIARAVNQRVVQAVMEAVRDQNNLGTYGATGVQRSVTAANGFNFSLNQQA